MKKINKKMMNYIIKQLRIKGELTIRYCPTREEEFFLEERNIKITKIYFNIEGIFGNYDQLFCKYEVI